MYVFMHVFIIFYCNVLMYIFSVNNSDFMFQKQDARNHHISKEIYVLLTTHIFVVITQERCKCQT